MTTFIQFAVFISVILASPHSRAQAPQSFTKDHDWEVKIEDLRKVPGEPLYRVTVSYLFWNRPEIWIDGLGMVVPQDRLTFTSAAVLTFREGMGKSPLVTVPLSSTIVSQPLEHGVEYPPTVTSATSLWRPYGEAIDLKREDKSFTGAAMKVLKEPSNGSAQGCRLEDNGCIFTAWIRVLSADRTKNNFNQGDVAVMLVHTPVTPGAQTGVHLVCYYVVRQGLSGSPEWDYTGGPDVQKAAMKVSGQSHFAIVGSESNRRQINMALRRAAIWLTVVFLLSLAINLLILALHSREMSNGQARTLLETVLKVHAVPLGALLAGVFSRQHDGSQVTRPTLITAIVVSGLWAAIVTWSWSGLPDRIEAPDVNTRFLNSSSDVAFLLVVMIGYFTGKTSTPDS